jgi:hypothetical protein
MRRWIFFTAMALVGAPRLGHAAPPVNWHGPPCEWGAASYKVCSPEPSSIAPCYTSHSADYVPNPVELALINICQRAKAASAAPPKERDHALGLVVNAGLDLKSAVEDYPNFAEDHSDDLKQVTEDLILLGESMIAYARDSSKENWEDIADVLDDLELNATTFG